MMGADPRRCRSEAAIRLGLPCDDDGICYREVKLCALPQIWMEGSPEHGTSAGNLGTERGTPKTPWPGTLRAAAACAAGATARVVARCWASMGWPGPSSWRAPGGSTFQDRRPSTPIGPCLRGLGGSISCALAATRGGGHAPARRSVGCVPPSGRAQRREPGRSAACAAPVGISLRTSFPDQDESGHWSIAIHPRSGKLDEEGDLVAAPTL